MTSRDSAASEITPEVLLRAYACGIFPMAESADDPTLFWVEPEMRGVIPLERLSHRLAAGAHGAVRRLHRDRQPGLQGRHRRVRRAAGGPRGHLDQHAHPRPLYRAARDRAWPQRRGLAGRRSRRRALWREPRAGVLRREHVPPRPRRIEGRAGASGGAADRRRLRAAATRNMSPSICARSARSKSRAGATRRCSTGRSRANRRISRGCRSTSRCRESMRSRSSPRAADRNVLVDAFS